LLKNLKKTTPLVSEQVNSAENDGITTSILQSTRNLGTTNRKKGCSSFIKYMGTDGKISLVNSQAGTYNVK
jgi:hypothetical protein